LPAREQILADPRLTVFAFDDFQPIGVASEAPCFAQLSQSLHFLDCSFRVLHVSRARQRIAIQDMTPLGHRLEHHERKSVVLYGPENGRSFPYVCPEVISPALDLHVRGRGGAFWSTQTHYLEAHVGKGPRNLDNLVPTVEFRFIGAWNVRQHGKFIRHGANILFEWNKGNLHVFTVQSNGLNFRCNPGRYRPMRLFCNPGMHFSRGPVLLCPQSIAARPEHYQFLHTTASGAPKKFSKINAAAPRVDQIASSQVAKEGQQIREIVRMELNVPLLIG